MSHWQQTRILIILDGVIDNYSRGQHDRPPLLISCKQEFFICRSVSLEEKQTMGYQPK